MKVTIVSSDGPRAMDLEDGCTLERAFRSMGGLPDTHLFLRDGVPVPMTVELRDGDEVEAVRIASGG